MSDVLALRICNEGRNVNEKRTGTQHTALERENQHGCRLLSSRRKNSQKRRRLPRLVLFERRCRYAVPMQKKQTSRFHRTVNYRFLFRSSVRSPERKGTYHWRCHIRRASLPPMRHPQGCRVFSQEVARKESSWSCPNHTSV